MLPFAALFLASTIAFGAAPATPAAGGQRQFKILAADDMQGRDTGSEGYKKAARYVVQQFEKSGLKPAGVSGFYQTVPLHSVFLVASESSASLVRSGHKEPLQWFEQITVVHERDCRRRSRAIWSSSAPRFPGVDLHGKIAVYFNAARGAACGGRCAGQALRAGIAATLMLDNPRAIEPARALACGIREDRHGGGDGTHHGGRQSAAGVPLQFQVRGRFVKRLRAHI